MHHPEPKQQQQQQRQQQQQQQQHTVRVLRSIGCESDPSDDLGRTVYLWTLIRLIDVWADEGNECGPAAYKQIVRVCNHGRAPLPQLLRLPPVSASYLGGRGGGRDRNQGGRGAMLRGPGPGGRPPPQAVGRAGPEVDSGGILAPLMEKLMETGHMEEFVEQVRVCVCACFTEARSAGSVPSPSLAA